MAVHDGLVVQRPKENPLCVATTLCGCSCEGVACDANKIVRRERCGWSEPPNHVPLAHNQLGGDILIQDILRSFRLRLSYYTNKISEQPLAEDSGSRRRSDVAILEKPSAGHGFAGELVYVNSPASALQMEIALVRHTHRSEL